MSGNPEIATPVRTGAFDSNVHDVGSGAPVLLIHGSGPGVSAWANWRLVLPARAQSIANSQLHVFGHCDHWTHIEHSERFNRLVGDLLAEAYSNS